MLLSDVKLKIVLLAVLLIAIAAACVNIYAQVPPSLIGWSYAVPITITERSGTDLANYTMYLSVNVTDLLLSNKLRPDHADLRFLDENRNPIPFVIEEYGGYITTKAYYGTGTSCLTVADNIAFPSTPNPYGTTTYTTDVWSTCDYCDFYMRIYLNYTGNLPVLLRVVSDDGHVVWVNGKVVGYAGGGGTATTICHTGGVADRTYNITSYLRQGKNEIWIWASEATGYEYVYVWIYVGKNLMYRYTIDRDTRYSHLARIALKLSLRANEVKTIYMYYGNPNATAPPYRPEDVYLFYDDFNTFDTSKWSLGYAGFGAVSYSVSGGLLKIWSPDGAWRAIRSTYTIRTTDKVIVEALVSILSTDRMPHVLYMLSADNADTQRFGVQENGGTDGNVLQVQYKYGGSYYYGSLGSPNVGNSWFIVRIVKNDTYTFYAEVYNIYYQRLGSRFAITYTGWTKDWWIGALVSDSYGIQYDWIRVRKYAPVDPSYSIGAEIYLYSARLPMKTVILTHNVTYSSNSTQITHTRTYAYNTTTTTLQTSYPHRWSWRVYVKPYQNTTAYYVPGVNKTITGTWLAGTVSNLKAQDYVYFRFRTYNSSNTMILVTTVNVTAASWLAKIMADPTITITKLDIVAAGNLSKVVNAKASLEILDWTTNTWITIDKAAWNQTSVTTKTYTITTNPKNYISPQGVIAFRINVTDVQAYPSTYVTCTFDQLNVRVTYINETEASYVHEVTITIPYGSALIRNVTLDIRANGTGTRRSVSIDILNATGYIVKSLANASFTTSWTRNVITLNQMLTNKMTIRIRTYLMSTLSSSEEIDIANVKVYLDRQFSPRITCPLTINLKYHNCSFVHTVDLGSSAYLNRSFIDLYIINYTKYNTTGYKYKPMLFGTRTIGADTYSVYRIEPANVSGSFTTYILLVNEYRIPAWRVHVHGYNLTRIIIGDKICVELPKTGNVTFILGSWSNTWYNTQTVCWTANSTGTLTIESLRNMSNIYSLGRMRLDVVIKYGNLTQNVYDLNGSKVDYESLKLVLYDKMTGRRYELTNTTGLFRALNLWAGNYSVTTYYLDVPICSFTFWLNSTTDGRIFNVMCNTFRLPRDYRGVSRTAAFTHNVSISVENLNKKYPLSAIRAVLTGKGPVSLAINYRSGLPTKITVDSNASYLRYDVIGTNLVVRGYIGSSVYVTITDLYRLDVTILDKLGRLILPACDSIVIRINDTLYTGCKITTYLYPETYVLTAPEIVKYNVFTFKISNVSRVVFNISNYDRSFKVFYRVPVKVELTNVYVAEERPESVGVIIEGIAVDYLGEPVGGRPVNITIMSETGAVISRIATVTDDTGHFSSSIIPLSRGVTYRVVAQIEDDVYTTSVAGEMSVKPEELPKAVRRVSIIELLVQYSPYIILGLLIAVFIVMVVVIARARRKSVEARELEYV